MAQSLSGYDFVALGSFGAEQLLFMRFSSLVLHPFSIQVDFALLFQNRGQNDQLFGLKSNGFLIKPAIFYTEEIIESFTGMFQMNNFNAWFDSQKLMSNAFYSNYISKLPPYISQLLIFGVYYYFEAKIFRSFQSPYSCPKHTLFVAQIDVFVEVISVFVAQNSLFVAQFPAFSLSLYSMNSHKMRQHSFFLQRKLRYAFFHIFEDFYRCRIVSPLKHP